MSIVERPALYAERTTQVTTQDEIHRALDELAVGKKKFKHTSMAQKRQLVRALLDGAVSVLDEWIAAACQAKGLPPGPAQGEEIAAGPLATLRYLRLLDQTLESIERTGSPTLPGKISDGPGGKLKVQVMPAKGLYDGLLFQGFKSDIWMQSGVTRQNLREHMASYYRQVDKPEGIALVLGAGNVSSIAPLDAFTKLFHEGKVVLLKMNPVNEYLGPIFAKAFRRLIEEGYLRIIYGGADVGSFAINHPLVDEVHITGSIYSHETIVWGPPGPERDRRKAENKPLLQKAITSELGNVTPWIVVPGPYSEKQLRFQAENVAAQMVNNASFNCIATKMIVTWKNWPDRSRFLNMIDDVLAKVPPRKAYYPGAQDRWQQFTGKQPSGCPSGTLPWTLVRDVHKDQTAKFFDEESFTCVCAETALDAASPEEFLDKSVEFANNELWGTLGAGLMVHPAFRKQAGGEARLERAIDRLRYGTVAINHWPALSYGMITPPWGGDPSGTLADPQSGLGWVHNTYMLEGIQKTVLEGPLVVSPKPFWFPTHGNAHVLGRLVVDLLAKPSLLKLPKLLLNALKG